jgi:hypothetical protein
MKFLENYPSGTYFGGECESMVNHGIIDASTTLHRTEQAKRVMGRSLLERTDFMIAGTDITALDATMCRIAGIDPEELLHLKLAGEHNLGLHS